jgi:4-methyl-5(b-hydroxyethyl)-thiazole monophosphate biosynthesis
MKNVCIPLIDVLRRAGFSVSTCGLTGLQVRGAHNVTVSTDIMIDEALNGNWDLVVLPGGMPGATNLRNDARVGKLLEQTVKTDGYIGAICAAPIALARFGFVKGKRATSYPGFSDQMPDANYCEDRVVCDGKVLTSRSPGTAMEFALAITELLAGRTKADELKKQMLVK